MLELWCLEVSILTNLGMMMMNAEKGGGFIGLWEKFSKEIFDELDGFGN